MTPFIVVAIIAALSVTGHVVDYFRPPVPSEAFPDSEAC